MSSRSFVRHLWYLGKRRREELQRTEKIEWYLAQIAQMIVIMGGSGKGPRPKLKQFLIKFKKPKKKGEKPEGQTWQEQKQVLTAAFERMRNRVKPRTPPTVSGVGEMRRGGRQPRTGTPGRPHLSGRGQILPRTR